MSTDGGHGTTKVPALALAALGVVYGDIGTSPLYAMRETFDAHAHEMVVSEDNVLGVLSLILYSLIIVISVKYVAFVMRAENDGEGGIMALIALLRPKDEPRRGRRWMLLLAGIFGAALLYGDAAITPAISVLSAVEGAQLVAPDLADFIVPIAVVILIGLFAIQSRGTATIGKFFGPIMLVWFTTLAVLGIFQISQNLDVLQAVNPVWAVRFFSENAFTGFLALGAVFLVVTGGEALYADMGHFGRRPIALAWYALVLPALLINYFGQGALLLDDPEAIESPLFKMAPEWALLPLVILATIATVIASQALISGVYSLTMQAIQLGYAPRHKIRHTSEAAFGQIYLPTINWALLAACIALVVGFGSSGDLAAAYGVAVTSTMVITTMLFYVVLTERFGWSKARAVPLCTGFMIVDLAFLGANLFKIPAGGWFPILTAVVMFTLMTTWHTGRRLVAERIRRDDRPLDEFVDALPSRPMPPVRVPGTAIYLFSSADLTPPALFANLRLNGALHEHVVIVCVTTAMHPRIAPDERAVLTDYGDGIVQVTLRYGFMEEPHVPLGLTEGAAAALDIDRAGAIFVLGAENLSVTELEGMAIWREHLFALIARNATPAASYFELPTERTVTIATPIEL